MNRADRIRKVAPGLPDDMVEMLAGKPAAEVDLLVTVARQAGRDALAAEAARRKQRKADAARHRHYSPGQLAERNLRFLESAGRQATRDLDALAYLAEAQRHHGPLIRMAVDSLRGQGISDALIGEALGITRQSVGERFGRKGSLTPHSRDRAG